MTDLVNDDIRHWAATYTGPAFHALLCDAPYEMAFMGKSWDASGIAFDPQTWRKFYAYWGNCDWWPPEVH